MTDNELMQENLQPSPGNSFNNQNPLNLQQTINDLHQADNASPLASLDSI
jgi:hypothetical protein